MSETAAVRAVVFDLGEVLASPGDLYSDLSQAVGLERDVFEEAYWAHRDDYDRGGQPETFWGAVLDDLDVPTDSALIDSLDAIDIAAWTSIRPSAADILRRLSDRGLRVAILSNAPYTLARIARLTAWGEYVTDWFFSGELAVAKPDRAIYTAVSEGLGLAPESLLFIDDRQVNVDAAREAGWQAHLWQSDADTENLLKGRDLV